MAKIVKKILPEHFELIASGKKKYELRLADFLIQEGDTLVLEEWNSDNLETRQPTGRVIEKVATYVRKFSFDELKQMKEKGFYIIQID